MRGGEGRRVGEGRRRLHTWRRCCTGRHTAYHFRCTVTSLIRFDERTKGGERGEGWEEENGRGKREEERGNEWIINRIPV